jgi:hypothetical protein
MISIGLSGANFSDPVFSITSIGSFSGSFFPQLRIFNNFSASFFGSFRFVFGSRSFVFNNLSGSFLKKGILFCFFVPEPVKKARFACLFNYLVRPFCLQFTFKPQGRSLRPLHSPQERLAR